MFSALISNRMRPEELLSALKVLRGIDAYCVEGRFGYPDGIAVLDPSELFEALGLFELAGGQVRYLTKHGGPIAIDADMAIVLVATEPLGRFHTSQEGDDTAAEVKCTHITINNDLGRIGILKGMETIGRSEGLYQGGYLSGGVVEALTKSNELFAADEGLVALNIHHDISLGAYVAICLPATVSPATVICARHDSPAPETLHSLKDALVVGADIGLVETGGDTPKDVLDYHLATQQSQRLAGEAGAAVTGRYECYVLHFGII